MFSRKQFRMDTFKASLFNVGIDLGGGDAGVTKVHFVVSTPMLFGEFLLYTFSIGLTLIMSLLS